MKPSLVQGTRDFAPEVVQKRSYILNTIRLVFELCGFQPLETPAFENIETLMGKYGEEGDKLIFKILNNGLENPDKHTKAHEDFELVLSGKNVKSITERALKYDLTIPFARYVAMNFNQITLPFKRYQMQSVWRADRPQRGRYREFTQCDADIVGSQSLLNEIELLQIYIDVFNQLHIPVSICINNRKILQALAILCGGEEKLISITVAIDKLDKIGLEKVQDELRNRGLGEAAVTCVNTYLHIAQGDLSNEAILSALSNLFQGIEIGLQGIEEVKILTTQFDAIRVDVSLARGLNYYTGTIIEVKPLGVQMGSIGGGGRYDDLTSLFGVPAIPGVGISFGVDRIYDVIEELNLFPKELNQSIEIMFVNFGETFNQTNLQAIRTLRKEGISCELFPDAVKFDKQLKYANKRGVNYVAMIGEDEFQAHVISFKNFKTGEQQQLTLNDIVSLFK